MAQRKPTNTKRNSAQLATTGSSLRMQVPKSQRKPKPKRVRKVVQEVNPVSGFVVFLREHAIVGLAIGFAIATQVQIVIKQLISSFVDPLYGLLLNGEKLSTKTSTIAWHGRSEQFAWGAFVYTILDLILVLAVIYAFIKITRLDKLDKPKEVEETEE